MKKRLSGILLSLALMLTMMPALGVSQTAYADSYDLWVGGVEVTSETLSGSGWSYEAGSNTLTLKGAEITTGHATQSGQMGIYYEGTADLNIVLQENSVNSISGSSLYTGIYASSAVVTFSGAGKLDIDTTSAGGANSNGIWAKGVTVQSGEISAKGNSTGVTSTGSDLTVSGGKLVAEGVRGISTNNTSNSLNIGKDASVTAIGSTDAITGLVKSFPPGRGWNDTAGTGAGERIITPDAGRTMGYRKVIFPDSYVEYPLRVKDTQVTSMNMDDVLGDGKVSYDPDSNTLKLNGAKIEYDGSDDSAIEYDGDSGLTIELSGTNKVSGASSYYYGIDSAKDTTVNGSGTLEIEGFGTGIYVPSSTLTIEAGAGVTASGAGTANGLYANNVTINGGAVNASVESFGIRAGNDITINGGTVNASASGNEGEGIFASNEVIINGGTVNASGTGAMDAKGISAEKVTVNGGIVTAYAKETRGQGIDSNAAVSIRKGLGVKAGADESSAQPVEDTAAWKHEEKWVRIKIAAEYPLWVSGLQVTSMNMDDVLGDGKVSYDPDTNTLTLNGADIGPNPDLPQGHAAIFYGEGEKDLIIDAVKASTLRGAESAVGLGISSQENLILRGTLTATGGVSGINCYGNKVTVSGKVTAKGTDTGIYLDAGDITISSGAELTAEGGDLAGIAVNDPKGTVTIKKGAKVSAVGGKAGAVDAIVKNAVAGTGWTDREGTAGETAIEINTEGQDLTGFKRVQFPAEVDKVTVRFNSAGGSAVAAQTIEKGARAAKPDDPVRDGYTFDGWYLGDTAFDFDSPVENNITLTAHWTKNETPANMSTITFDLNGGTWEGMTGIVTMDLENGTVITLPAPTRDGYTFDYWEGSKYYAGDEYTVNGDHSFKAVWKTADNGGSGNGSKGGSSGKRGVNTGDDNALGAWIVLLAAALTGTTGMVFARKRRGE